MISKSNPKILYFIRDAFLPSNLSQQKVIPVCSSISSFFSNRIQIELLIMYIDCNTYYMFIYIFFFCKPRRNIILSCFHKSLTFTSLSFPNIIRITVLYLIHPFICSINVISAGNHSTESNLSFVSHLAASCSLRTKSPDIISAQKQSIERWNVG